MKMSVGRSCRPCLSLIAPPGLRPAPCGTLPLAPRAAGARVVSATPRVLVCIEAHDVGGREVAPHLLGHEAHGRVDVVKEVLEAGAQVVEPGSPEGSIRSGGHGFRRSVTICRCGVTSACLLSQDRADGCGHTAFRLEARDWRR